MYDDGRELVRDLDGGNFHLEANYSVFADIAQWQTGDPPWDIDHEDRPMTDGASDYAGADVP